MKAELVALTGFGVLAASGGAVAYNLWLASESERAVNAVIEQRIAESGLKYPSRLAIGDAQGIQWLEALYAKPGEKERLHAGYAALRAAWTQDAPRLARRRSWFSDHPIDEARLGLEIDERFGEGAAALMEEQDARRREEAIAAERERRDLEDRARILAGQDMGAVADYIALYDRYPPAGSRIENGRVVEP